MFLAAFTSALTAKPQTVQTKRAWLSRDSRVRVPARRAPLAGESRTYLFHPARAPSLPVGAPAVPSPTSRILAVEPGLSTNVTAGVPRGSPWLSGSCSLIWRSSTLIRSNRRTMAVLAFSASPCACPSRGPSIWRRRASPVLDGWSPAWRGRAFVPADVASSAPAWPGRGRAATHPSTGRRTRRPLGLYLPPGWCRALRWPRELRRTRYASGRRGQGSPDKTSCQPVSRGTSGTAPTRPSEPRLHRSSG